MKEATVHFFVIGAARAGTTTLYSYLSQHPDIFLPNVKECNYFSSVQSLDKEVYKEPKYDKKYHMKIIASQKVYNNLFLPAKATQLKGDVSPSYLWDRDTAKRIFEHNSEAKIILSLRNPIDRAYSHYLMHYNTGYETEKTFEEALNAPKKPIWGGGNMYLEMSSYFNQVKPYFDCFPSENIKVLIYEDWTKNKEKAFHDIYSFLGIQSFSKYAADEVYNKTQAIKNKKALDILRQEKVKRSIQKLIPEAWTEKVKQQFFYKETEKTSLSEETITRLKRYFKDDVKKTENLIQQPLTQKWNFKND
ncbi:sulfotransferase [Marixanthomonas sp. SCSIO 43207]|uniref:sulfotransferase family protein n=1 Tax=Marixanthomonas sp. SCSIO 43207 TaxID=2779360 RepID=UPI001CA8F46A|nr:sulfotransferase [Marixanthomonas sp. SCSIO 43207]UAB81923.1 sulfotransferase [Marixanthomonas sp. SCSIO 43207]